VSHRIVALVVSNTRFHSANVLENVSQKTSIEILIFNYFKGICLFFRSDTIMMSHTGSPIFQTNIASLIDLTVTLRVFSDKFRTSENVRNICETSFEVTESASY